MLRPFRSLQEGIIQVIHIVIPEHFNPHSGTPQTFWVTRPDSSLNDLAVEEFIGSSGQILGIAVALRTEMHLCQRLCKPKLFEAEMEHRKQLLSTVSETLWDCRECNSRIREEDVGPWLCPSGLQNIATLIRRSGSSEQAEFACLSYLLTLILLY